MKAIYANFLSISVLCALFVLSNSNLKAQPTLTHENISPQVGDTYLMHSTDYMLPGPAGENVTCDF